MTAFIADEQHGGFSHVDIKSGDNSYLCLPCQNLVIAAGLWSDTIFSQLFPSSPITLQLAKKQPAQDWVRFTPSNASDSHQPEDADDISQQVFLGPALPENEDIHFSSDYKGAIYAAGKILDSDPPFSLPENVKMDPMSFEELKNLSARYLRPKEAASYEILDYGRAYLPRTVNDLPIIIKLRRKDLDGSSVVDGKEAKGGVFLNFGHYLDGFTLGPGSGKVMSELIRGVETSIDLTPFELNSLCVTSVSESRFPRGQKIFLMAKFGVNIIEM